MNYDDGLYIDTPLSTTWTTNCGQNYDFRYATKITQWSNQILFAILASTMSISVKILKKFNIYHLKNQL